MPVIRIVLAAALASTLPATAAAQAAIDWFASLYTPEGVELRADERVFALYALLNAAGYDEAPVSRRDPVPKREFHPVRARVRAAGAALDPAIRTRIDAFFDSHAAPLPNYLAYAVHLTSAPKFAPAPSAPKDLAGLDSLLAQVHDKMKLAELFEQVQDEHRSALRGYLKDLDGPLSAVRRLLKLKEDDAKTRTVVVVNLLDGAGKSEALWSGSEQVVVVGPAPRPDATAVVREFARLHVAPAVARKAASYKVDGSTGVRGGPAEYAIETCVRAAAARAAMQDKAQEAEFDAAVRAGLGGVREMAKVLDEFARSDRPLDAYLSETWPRVEAARKK